jgi:hypothetical protein
MDSVLALNVDELRVSALRHRQAEFAARFNLDLDQYLRIVRACNTVEVITVLELLRSAKFRSVYREKCAIKIRSWIEDVRPVGKPLASWEFIRCTPSWRIPYSLPTL